MTIRTGKRGSRAGYDDGFTLIEVMTAIALAGILMAISTWTFMSYVKSSRESNTATEVRSALRNASERSLSQGRTFCVYFNVAAATYTTYRADCTVAANKVASGTTDASNIGLQLPSPAFAPPASPIANQTTACPVANACAYFYPRGNALAGRIQVTRSGSTKVYTISVEGLTSRVSLA